MQAEYLESVGRSSGGVQKIGRKAHSADSVAESPKKLAPKSRSSQKSSRKENASSTTTAPIAPKPSEPLFSINDFTVRDPEQLRTLMHESLQGFAVELGIPMAASLLEDDVIQLCGSKSERVLNRAASRHGSQQGYVVLGDQKVATRRPRVRSVDASKR